MQVVFFSTLITWQPSFLIFKADWGSDYVPWLINRQTKWPIIMGGGLIMQLFMIQHDSDVSKVSHVNIFILNHRPYWTIVQQMLHLKHKSEQVSEFHNLILNMFHCESHSFIDAEL